MPNEACFYYIVEGQSRSYTVTGKVDHPASEGLVLQCGNYVTEFLEQSDSKQFEAIAIHLYPETLRLIYDKDFPNFLEEIDRVQPINYERYKSTRLLTTYINSL
ncbi:MAG: hypothetical protein ACJAZ9_000824 [Neolewinella sp.]|jgi:hypothetical protein